MSRNWIVTTFASIAIFMTTAAAQTPPPLMPGDRATAQHSGNILISAGFVMYPANTHAHLELLKRMPANKFMARKTSQGSTYFVYADPNLCVCTYVGSQAAMDAYRTAISSSDQVGLSQKGSQSVEEDVVFGMENDDAENEFRRSVLGSDFVPGYVPGFGN